MDFLDVFTAIVVVLLLIRMGVLFYNYLTQPLLPKASFASNKLVSVLIPARNEEQNISNLLNDLIKQDYPTLEIMVYDDLSEDKTATVIEEFSRHDKRVRLILGKTLPKGWLGKNHACHRLAMEARGHYYLFLDADVRLHPSAISSALNYFEEHGLQALSLFPSQIMLTRGERAFVPLMLWVLLTLLPLRLVEKMRFSSLAAANGQFFLHESTQYQKYHWHSRFRMHRVEDVAIARALKKEGLKIATLLGNRLVSCRMYANYTQALHGFSKNFPFFFGNKLALMYVFLIFSTFGWLLPVFTWPGYLRLPLVLSLVVQRCLLAKLIQIPCQWALLDLPIQQSAFVHLAFYIALASQRNGLQWKGRKLNGI